MIPYYSHFMYKPIISIWMKLSNIFGYGQVGLGETQFSVIHKCKTYEYAY